MKMLDVSELHVAYGPIEALHGISIKVDATEIVTVIGANGAGKSTFLKTVCGILSPVRGRLVWEGQDVTGSSSAEMIKRGIALVPEGRHVFPEMTVRENLELGAYYRKDINGIKSDLEATLDTFPILRERLKLHAGSLSGGQQQMLAIGRAVMSRPRLLMLDEPSLGLAPTIVQQVAQIVRDLNKSGTTILLVEQNARLALRLADRAYALANGRVVRTGTGNELLKDPAIQESYLGGLAA